MFHYTVDDKKGEVKTTKHIILRDTPYHYLIDSTGQVAEGRELRFSAYSNTQYITPIEKHITVVLGGDFDKVNPTNNQIQSLVLLLTELAKVHDIRLKNIGYHRDVVKKEVRKDGGVKYGTDCPGKNLIDIFDQEVKQKLAGNGVR